MIDRIDKIKTFVLDMDGTIYLGNELFPFTKKFLKDVEDQHKKYYFFTNNSSKDQQTYIDKLEKMEIEIKPEQMMISNHLLLKHSDCFTYRCTADSKDFILWELLC